ncbi:MAG: Hsp70 family protein [Pseudomonadota bacterium]
MTSPTHTHQRSENTSLVAGLDFGTSNSAIGFATHQNMHLHVFDHGESATPTALFYDDDDQSLVCGYAAERRFLAGNEGRYLRALKSILGTSLAEESTKMGRQSIPFRALLAKFLRELKHSVEAASHSSITKVVAGRPVRFIDDDNDRDAAAEDLLHTVLGDAGFQEISFVFEPVAALIDSEPRMPESQIVLVADIGGGTSDFTVAERTAEQSSESLFGFRILANHGVHIGGTDLDKQLSLNSVMPALGLGSEMKASTSDTILPVPRAYFTDLATWQKIHFCYTPTLKREVREVLRYALQPEKIERLATVLEDELGHGLANAVEKTKINLNAHDTARLEFPELPSLPNLTISQEAMSAYLQQELSSISRTAAEALSIAGVNPEAVDHIVMTGGSTLLPDVRRSITDVVPNGKIVEADPFTAVAHGLTKAAQKLYL